MSFDAVYTSDNLVALCTSLSTSNLFPDRNKVSSGSAVTFGILVWSRECYVATCSSRRCVAMWPGIL